MNYGIININYNPRYERMLTVKPLFRYPLYFEPKKGIDNGNVEEIKLIKLNIFIKKEGKNLIEICLKFEEKGNYLIKLTNSFETIYFMFFVKVFENNNEKLISKIFENLTEEEIGIFKGLKRGIEILVSKTTENNLNDGELVVFEEEMFEKNEIISKLTLQPLIDDGNYLFEMEKGKIKEKIKEINPKINLIKILKLREIKNVCKNKFKELAYQKWFLFNYEEYYKMNDCFIAEKLIDEED